jgi:hypothetical protein
MNTPLDTTPTWLWFPESAEYKDKELRLLLVEGSISKSRVDVDLLPGVRLEALNPLTLQDNARKFLIHFEDVKALHVLDEVAHKGQIGESREPGVIGQHHQSALLAWLAASTKLADITPGELLHYSVETAEEFYHVVTRVPPVVTQQIEA